VPLEDNSVDIALLSQALHHASNPTKAIEEAFRILKPGGKIVVIDLLEHDFEKARELYADVWLGFSENKLYQMLKDTGFSQTELNIVSKEVNEPHFQTLLASGIKH
jgi:ArsR family transcriptional regulator